jgi:hypothetical protein
LTAQTSGSIDTAAPTRPRETVRSDTPPWAAGSRSGTRVSATTRVPPAGENMCCFFVQSGSAHRALIRANAAENYARRRRSATHAPPFRA